MEIMSTLKDKNEELVSNTKVDMGADEIGGCDVIFLYPHTFPPQHDTKSVTSLARSVDIVVAHKLLPSKRTSLQLSRLASGQERADT